MIFEGIPCTAPQPHTTHAAQFPGGLLPAIRDAPKLSEPFSVVRLPNFRFFGVKLVGFHRFLVAEIDVSPLLGGQGIPCFFFTGDINHIPWRTRSCTTPEYFTSCWGLAGFLLRGSFHLILVSLRAHQISPWVFLLTSHPLVGSYPSSCGVNPIQQITPPFAQFSAIWGINTISCLLVFSPQHF